jgi:hypothetical protein
MVRRNGVEEETAAPRHRNWPRFLGLALVLLVSSFLTPIPHLLLWRWKISEQLGRSQPQVLESFGEPDIELKPTDPKASFIHYPPLNNHPPENKVLVYGFMNVRALLYVASDGNVNRVTFVDLPSQTADHDVILSYIKAKKQSELPLNQS